MANDSLTTHQSDRFVDCLMSQAFRGGAHVMSITRCSGLRRGRPLGLPDWPLTNGRPGTSATIKVPDVAIKAYGPSQPSVR
jgi:hypothetical protein